MSHDRNAELAGYENELALAEQYGRKEKASAVRDEIRRVKAEISKQARAEQVSGPETADAPAGDVEAAVKPAAKPQTPAAKKTAARKS